jgi:glycyl-tRNA synthetase
LTVYYSPFSRGYRGSTEHRNNRESCQAARLCFPSSDIYGGLGSAWDYGSLGTELCNNVKQEWWRWMVHERDDMEGIDSSIILNRQVWKYSGHEETLAIL